jgi:hypothetical protein
MKRYLISIVLSVFLTICFAILILTCYNPARLVKSSQKNKESVIEDHQKFSYNDFYENAEFHQFDQQKLDFLLKNGFILTNTSYNQIFEPYVKPNKPVFITSDTIINAYNIIFEEAIYRIEASQAQKLPGILEIIYENIDKTDLNNFSVDSKTLQTAKTRAKLVVGTALMLLDRKFTEHDVRLIELMNKEAQKIRNAEGIGIPDWIKSDSSFKGINYESFKPIGFYTQTPNLTNYFQAVKWLQTVPFRPEYDDELAAILVIGATINPQLTNQKKATKLNEAVHEYLNCFNLLTGIKDNPDINDMHTIYAAAVNQNALNKPQNLALIRSCYTNITGNYMSVNDSLRTANPNKEKSAVSYRVISAYQLPDSQLFQQTLDQIGNTENLPTGLKVASALGSGTANEIIKQNDPNNAERLIQVISGCKQEFRSDNLYNDYLESLSILFHPPNKNAPEFIKGKLWERKNLQTVLSGWALMRHSLILQTKMNMISLSRYTKPSGFVEPVPEFYSKFATLIEKTDKILSKNQAYSYSYRRAENIAILRDYAKLIRKKMHHRITEEENLRIDIYTIQLETLSAAYNLNSPSMATAGRIEKIAAKMESDQDYYYSVLHFFRQYEFDLSKNLRELKGICKKLEELSVKQLENKEFSQEDSVYIRDFGEKLAGTMFYQGNSYQTPCDDAPRITSIAYNPNTARYLEVGTGRPETIYVLYPYQGKTILCIGAVMTYQ